MVNSICYWFFCFTPIEKTSYERIFGFSEYLTAVALLAVLFTITDVRYKFRIAVTPGKLYLTSFYLIAIIGLQTLLTEIWIAERWWVPVTGWITYSIWQGIFGFLFLGTFLTWMYYAFIRPPIFGKRNAHRYAQELYRYVLRGSDEELKVIANELVRSSASLVKHSRTLNTKIHKIAEGKVVPKKAGVEDFAHDILLLIGNRKLCRHIVTSSPITAQAFFEEMSKAKKYKIPIGQFAKNISSEAISLKESFIYEEAEGYSSGLLGYLKPVSLAVYGNYALIETLAKYNMSPLDISYEEQNRWDAKQWEAFCRAILISFGDYLSKDQSSAKSNALISPIKAIKMAFSDLYKLDGLSEIYDKEIYYKLSVCTEFITNAIELIDKQIYPPSSSNYIYDCLALLIFEMCFEASKIKSPHDTCWTIHHNLVWSNFFDCNNGTSWKIVRFKVRRLLYDEIAKLSRFPNYKGAKILGYCLNVLGLGNIFNKKTMHDSYALTKATESWATKNYLKLRKQNSDVADSVLIGSISYDEKRKRLVKTYIKGLSKTAPQEYLDLK